MNYTPFILWLAGFLGVVLHNLVKLNDIKKAHPDGEVNYGRYFKMEWITILISVIVVAICVIFSQEIKELNVAGKYLGLGFVFVGYTAQSLLVKWMGKAEGIVKAKSESNA